ELVPVARGGEEHQLGQHRRGRGRDVPPAFGGELGAELVGERECRAVDRVGQAQPDVAAAGAEAPFGLHHLGPVEAGEGRRRAGAGGDGEKDEGAHGHLITFTGDRTPWLVMYSTFVLSELSLATMPAG